jgi:hypothetical protein
MDQRLFHVPLRSLGPGDADVDVVWLALYSDKPLVPVGDGVSTP